MNNSMWKGKIAVVTGASAGIGAAIAVELAKHGLITFGLARRAERVEALKEKLSAVDRRNLLALKCDVSDERSIIEAFSTIEKLHGGVDILINNAGVIHEGSTLDPNNSDIMRSVIDTNVMGLVFCTREAFKSMKARKSDGHIIHINSIGGHKIPVHMDYPSFGVYGASKYAVTALTEQHRQDIIREKMNVKVSVSFICDDDEWLKATQLMKLN
jgi:NADP+-dependent farnesol dehydrogenase